MSELKRLQENLDVALKYLLEGNYDNAEKIYKLIIEIFPEHPEAFYYLGLIFSEKGENEKAIPFLQKALSINPNITQAHYNLGVLYMGKKNFPEAEKSFRKALDLKPDWAEAYNNLGNALMELKHLSEALECYFNAIRYKPDWVDVYNNIGILLTERGFPEEASIYFQKVFDLKPDDYAKKYYNLGVLYMGKKNFPEAEKSFRKALDLKPDWAEAYNNLGNVLMELKHLSEALECYFKAIRYKPDWVDVYNNIGTLLLERGFLEEALVYFQKIIDLKPHDYSNRHIIPLSMQYKSGLSQERWKKELDALSLIVSKFPPVKNYNILLNFKKKLRIGYLSTDFCKHSCSWFFIPLLISHNRNTVEINCFSLTKTEDDVTEKIKKLTDKWFNINNLTDQEAVKLILNNKIDILVDLAGHTSNNRLGIFSCKPAPIQVTWLGSPGSTGLNTIDYRLSDLFLTPENTTEYYSEKIWNLGRLSHCYKPPEDAPAVDSLPLLENEYVTFGSFNVAIKISTETLELWAEVMKKVSKSRIKIKLKYGNDEELRNRLFASFNKNGIEKERIDILSFQPTTRGHLEYYNQLDIALDTFPYNGATTTLEALWMGVPVISLVGDRTASRYGLSFLSAINLPELATNNKDDYIEIVLKLANNPDYLASLRANLRQKMIESQICDYQGFAREIEITYRKMWKRWCLSQKKHI